MLAACNRVVCVATHDALAKVVSDGLVRDNPLGTLSPEPSDTAKVERTPLVEAESLSSLTNLRMLSVYDDPIAAPVHTLQAMLPWVQTHSDWWIMGVSECCRK